MVPALLFFGINVTIFYGNLTFEKHKRIQDLIIPYQPVLDCHITSINFSQRFWASGLPGHRIKVQPYHSQRPFLTPQAHWVSICYTNHCLPYLALPLGPSHQPWSKTTSEIFPRWAYLPASLYQEALPRSGPSPWDIYQLQGSIFTWDLPW